MKCFFLILFSFLLLTSVYSQQVVTDISPDGAESNTYTYIPGNGTALRSQDVPFPSMPTWQAKRDRQIGGLAFGDYDQDGDLDLAVGCYYSQSFPPINDYENFIFKNNNGVLDTLPAWITADERTTTDIKWADINMDGKPDLVSANGQFQHSTLYLNSDTGLTRVPAWVSNDNVWTVGAALCDIDGDGDLDLAMGNQGVDPLPYKPIHIFYNNNGTLSTTPTWSSGDEMITNSVAFADINNSDLTQHNVTYSATGSGYVYLLPMTPVYTVDIVLVNGIQTYNYTYDPLNCWLALGFKPAAGSQVDISYTYIKHGDMASAKWVYFESGIYFNNNSVLNLLPGWTCGNTETQKGVAWADIDLDGFMDLAIGGNGIPNYIYKNNNGTISSTPYWSSSSSNTGVQDLIWGDVNKDGYPDLAVVHFGNRRVEIFLNRGGNLDSSPTWTYITTTSATTIAFGDVNGDGWLDLAVGTAREPVMLFIADSTLLPVELVSFNADIINDEVLLSWQTLTEKNNRGFEIERKISSEEWNTIAFIPGNGTTTSIHTYAFKDKPHSNGKYLYRLKQIDYDGSFTYSRIVEADYILNFTFRLDQNYPNPFNPETIISYQIPEKSFVTLKVHDILGREIAVLINEEQSRGEHQFMFDPAEYRMTSGVYLYTLSGGDLRLTRKMIYAK